MTGNILMAIEQAFINLWVDVVGTIPTLVAAAAVFIIGLFIASVAQKITRKVIMFLNVDTLAERMRMQEMLGKAGLSVTFADVFGTIVRWFFIIVFLNVAVDMLGWTQITLFLNDVLRYIPQVIIAVIILAIGLIAASFVEQSVVHALTSAKTHIKSPETLGSIAKWFIVVFSVMAGLAQLGIAESLINILFTAVLFTFALSFGLAGKEHATKFLDRVLK